MTKRKQWGAAFLWFFGVIAAGLTMLSFAVTTIEFIHRVPFDILSDAVYTWAAVFFIIAFVPILMVSLDVADDRFLQEVAEIGELTLLFGNPFGLVYSAWRRLVIPGFTLFGIVRSNLHLKEDDAIE